MSAPLPDTRSAAVVREILAEADIRSQTAAPLLLSNEFDTWLLDEQVVVKFAKDEEMAEKLGRERRFHDCVRARLGEVVPALRFAFSATALFPLAISGYERARGIQGQSATGDLVALSARQRSALAVDVASVLVALHSIPLEEAIGCGLEEDDELLPDRRSTFSAGVIARASSVAGEAVGRFLAQRAPDAPIGFVACHADIKGEHVFLAPSLDGVSALIDWADTSISDPAEDLGGLVGWLGPSFVREVVATGPWDSSDAERAIFRAREGILGYMLAAERGDEPPDPPGLLQALIRTAFSD